MAQRVGNEKTARSAINVAEFLTPEGNHWRVDDGQHLFDMIEKEPVEEDFVRVLKLAQIDVAFEIVGFEGKCLVGADTLIVERFDNRGKKAVETKDFALRFREGGAFVERRIVQQIHAAKMDFTSSSLLTEIVPEHSCEIVSSRRARNTDQTQAVRRNYVVP